MKALFASSLSALAASALFLAAGSISANAADYIWDTVSGDGATITAGSGAWSTTGTNWNNAGTNVAWSQVATGTASHSAIFGGEDGTYTVTLSGTTNAQSVTFNNSGYTLTAGTLTLRPTGTTNGSITVAANKTATIRSPIVYSGNSSANITANSGATLNLHGGSTPNVQYRFVAGSGTVNMITGTYNSTVGTVNTATFNQSGGTFNIILPSVASGVEGDGFFIGNNPGRNVIYTLSGGTINANAAAAGNINSILAIGRATTTAQSSTLHVQGAGTLNVGTTANRSGELQIASLRGSNGTLDVSGGTVTVGTGTTNNKIYFFKRGADDGYTANMTQSGGTVTANGIQFGGGADTYSGTSSATLTLSGGSLYVGAQGITRGSAADTLPVTIKLQGGVIGASDSWSSSLDMKLGATGGGPTFQAATSGGVSKNITLSGVLSDDTGVSGALIKTGIGTLTLSGSNTYSGNTTISAGILRLGASNVIADGAGKGNVSVASGATFDLSGFSESINGLTGAGTVDNSGDFSSTLTVGSVAGGVFSGTIKNTTLALSLTKTGNTDVILTGSNSYSGSTTINQGRLFISGGNSLSANTAVTVNGGSLVLNASGAPTYAQSITLNNNSILSVRQAATLSNVSLPSSGIVSFNNDDQATQLFSLGSNVSLSGDLDVRIGGGLAAPGSVTLTGIISGTANLTKSGTGTLTLSGSNTYTGATTVTAGTLALGANNVLSNETAVSIGAATLPASQATLHASQDTNNTAGTLAVTGSATINLGSGATLAFADSSEVDWTAGTLNITGTFVPGASLRFDIDEGKSGLTRAQLDKISVVGFSSSSLVLDDSGYLTSSDSTPPTLMSIVDNRGGGSIRLGTPVTYTVTFSKPINPVTVTAESFENFGTANFSIGTIIPESANVFSVEVTPSNVGSLILQIVAGAVIEDSVGYALDTNSAIPDDTTIMVNDSPLPTLNANDIVDDKSGQPVPPGMMVTYTVTFNEDIDATTVSSADFDNAGTSTITIGTITETTTPGEFTVEVTPTSTGTLRLSVKEGAVIKAALSGNVLDTTSAIVDDDTITVGNSYLYWDIASDDGTTITSGTGTWDLTLENTVWNSGTSNVAWSQTATNDANYHAVFSGTDGTLNPHIVTVDNTMAAESLTFSSSGYQITSGTLALMPTGTTNGSITVAANKTATIDSAISYAENKAADITASSGATLNLGGGASNSQYTFKGAGTVNITGGSYEANIGAINVGNFNISGGTYNLTPGGSNGYNFGNAVAHNVNVNVSGSGSLTLNNTDTNTAATAPFIAIGNNTGTTANTTSLTVQSGGTLTIGGNQGGRAAEIRISNSGNANGLLDVQGGTVTVGTGTANNKIYLFKNGATAGYTANMTQSGGTVTTNGIQFGGAAGTYDATSSANMTLSGGNLYVGAQGITRGSGASALPVSIKLEGGTLGADQNWNSPLNMQLGTAGGGVTIRAADVSGTGRLITLSGNLSDVSGASGTLTKAGGADLILSGSNSYSGGTTINAGRLFINSADALPSTGAVTVNAGTLALNASGTASFNQSITLNTGSNLSMRKKAALSNVSLPTSGIVTFNQDGEATQEFSLGSNVGLTGNLNIQVGGGLGDPGKVILTGVISGTNTLTKSGSGTLMLSASNTYTGATVVSAGTLGLGAPNAVSTSSGLTVDTGAGLALSSSSSDVPNLTFAGTGTLTFNNVSLGRTLTVNGNVTDSGVAGSITIHIDGAAPAAGTYTLIDYSGTLQGSGFSAYTLGRTPLGKTYNLKNNSVNGAVELEVTSFYKWTGINGSEWTTDAVLNWDIDASGVSYSENNLAVIFDDTAIEKTVNITKADVTPLSVLFNSGTYTLGGSFKIGGSAPVTVASGATLKLGSSNVLPDGVGAGNVTINGILDLNGNSDTINALLGNGIVENTVSGTSTLTVGANAGGIFSGTLRNTTGTLALTKAGATDVILSGSNSYSGATTINQGRLFINGGNSLSANTAVTVNGGSLVLNASGAPTFAQSITLNNNSNLSARQAATLSNVTLAQNGTVTFNQDDVSTAALTVNNGTTALNGTLTVQVGGGSGAPAAVTLSGILSGGSGNLVKIGSGQLTLTGSNSFSGGVTIKNGTLESRATQFTLGSGTVTMGGVGSDGATYTTGQNNSNQFVINTPDSGNIVIGANSGASGFTLSGGINLNGDLNIQTFNNAISGATKAAAGITGGVSGTGNLLLDNLGLAANTITFTTGTINHTGSITLQGTATGDTAIGSVIGANVTSVTQNSATSRLILSGSNSFNGLTIKNGTLNATTSNNALGGGTVTMGGDGSNGVILTIGGTNTIGRTYANDFTINAPDSGSVLIAANGGEAKYTLTGGINLNGNLTLQTFDTTSSGTASGTIKGGITGTGNLVLNNLGLAANTLTLDTGAINHTGSITNVSSGTAASGDTTISAPIGANVTGITQSSTTSRLVLSGSNSYASNLTINAGTVRISNNSNTANDVSTVSIASDATLDLTYVGTDRVANLVIDGVDQPKGVYGKVDSTDPSVTQQIAQITGDGKLTVGAPEIAVEYPVDTVITSGGSQDFGSVEVNSNTELTFTIRNSGDIPLNLTSTPAVGVGGTHADDFEVTAQPLSASIAAEGTTTFTVTFTPAGEGERSAVLTINNDDSDEGSYVINLTGSGTVTNTGAPEIVVEQPAETEIASGSSQDFGTVALASDTSLTFTIRNSGTAELSLTGNSLVAISGADADDFTVSTAPSASVVAAAGTTTFVVTFAPSAAGERNATLTIESNDSDEGSYVINLTGTGQSAFDAWSGGAAFNADANGDGVSNGLAWILGAANPSADARSLLPTVSTTATNMVFTFKRTQASINASTALSVEVGTTLAAWSTTYNVGADTAGSTSGVTIAKDSPSAGTDTVTVTVARGSDGKKFARLKAVLTP